jgi:O-antigen/teichoic acid export membrane protein
MSERVEASPSSLPSRFGRNVTSSWARIATQTALAIVMTPVLVHGLGKTEYGIWALAFSLVLYLELFEFGLGTATVKYVAESEATADRERTLRSIATSFWTLTVPGLGALGLAVVVALSFPLLFDVSPESERAAQLLILLVGLDLAVSIPSDTFGNTLLALQRFDVINATLIAVLVAQAAAWTIILALGGGLVALGVATIVLSLLGQLSRFLIARRLLPGVSVSPRLFDRRQVRPLTGLSLWYALAETSTLVIARLDTVVVGLLIGVPEAAVYAVAQKAAFLVDQVIRPMLRMFFPYSSELAARRERRALAETILTGTRVSMAIAGPLTLTLGLLAEPALRAWVGPGFAEGALVVVFLCAAAAVSALTGTGFLMLQGAGFARRPALLSAGEAVLNLALSVALGSQLGIKGVALATLVAASVVQLGILLPYVGRVFRVPLSRLIGGVARAHVPAALVALAVGWLVLRTDVSGLLELAAGGVAIGGAYVLMLALTGLDPDERRVALAFLRTRASRHATPSA